MSILISQVCEAKCGKPRNQHTKKERERCSKIKQQMRLAGTLNPEPINQKSVVRALPPRSISSKHYKE